MTLHLSQESIDKVLPNIKERANYQRRFLLGYQRVSGGDLKGKANRYGLSYKTSRNKVFGLLHDAGIYFLQLRIIYLNLAFMGRGDCNRLHILIKNTVRSPKESFTV